MLRLSSGSTYFSRVVLSFSPDNLEMAFKVLPEEFQESFIRISQVATGFTRALGTSNSLQQYEICAKVEVVELTISPHRGSLGFTVEQIYEFESTLKGGSAGLYASSLH